MEWYRSIAPREKEFDFKNYEIKSFRDLVDFYERKKVLIG